MPTLCKAGQNETNPLILTDIYTSHTDSSTDPRSKDHIGLQPPASRPRQSPPAQGFGAVAILLLTPELAYLVLTLVSQHPAPLHVCSSLTGNLEFNASANSHRQAHKHGELMQLFSPQPGKTCHIMSCLPHPFLRNS